MSEARAKPLRRPPTLDDVLRTLRVHLPELRERYGVRTLGVFGSYVRGEQRPRSDLDLLVEFDERPLTLIQVIGLEQYLSDLAEEGREASLSPCSTCPTGDDLTPRKHSHANFWRSFR